jgi:quercetin dioxygenase-like cupin family protein
MSNQAAANATLSFKAFCAASLAAAIAVVWNVVLAQAPVPMGEDPSYKRLLYTAHLRMFDVTIPPGASTLDHVRDHDVVTVALADATVRTRVSGGEWTDSQSLMAGSVDIAEYTAAASTYRMENVGKMPYRAFAIENLRDRGWSTPQLITAQGTKLLAQSRSFAVYEVQLNASASRTSHVHQMPTVVMLLRGGVEVQGGGGESEFRMETAGRWFPSQWDQPHTLTLVGGADAHLVEVEAR